MEEISEQQELLNLQTALAIAGVSANLMSVELIATVAQAVKEKGPTFSIADASAIKAGIQKKYGLDEAGIPVRRERPAQPAPIARVESIKMEPVKEEPPTQNERSVQESEPKPEPEPELIRPSISDLMKGDTEPEPSTPL
jgi:hypothetical protein